MDTQREYAFIDESGTANVKIGRILVISAIVTNNPILLARAFKAAEKKNRSNKKKNTGEMKAAAQLPSTRKRILSYLNKCDFSVYSLIIDTTTISNIPYSFDDIYTVGMSMLCSTIYFQYPEVCFILDKRYTNPVLRNLLNDNIKELLRLNYDAVPEKITILHGDSVEYAELRAADFVAYETYQNYKIGSDAYNVIAGRVASMTVFQNTTWGEIKKESRTPHN